MSDDILDTIDGALVDYRTSTDAMRWTATPKPLWASAHPNPILVAAFTVNLRPIVASYVSAMRTLAETLKAATPKSMHAFNVAVLKSHRSPRDYRRHLKHCRICNPRGNPAPLRIDGHAYHRRSRARQRRARG